MKNTIIAVLAVALVGVCGYLFFLSSTGVMVFNAEKETAEDNEVTPVTEQEEATSTPEETPEVVDETKTVIGTSGEGNAITAYHFGTGETDLLFIGGIHAGYSWNTVLLAYEFMDYLEENPKAIPENVRVTIIPVMNPDGLDAVVGTTDRFVASDVPTAKDATIPGRFNANDVDLNRNFDCDWQAEGVWQNRKVSGGTKALSEPESKAVADYVTKNTPDAVVVWYSASGGVFASNCHGDVLSETSALTKLYAKASGYKAFESFNFYEVTGDMVNWFAKEGIPAISVLLTNHTGTEWSKNKAGIEAMLTHYAE